MSLLKSNSHVWLTPCCPGKATPGGWASDWTCRPEPRRRLWPGSTEEDDCRCIPLHYATGNVAALNGRGTMHQFTTWTELIDMLWNVQWWPNVSYSPYHLSGSAFPVYRWLSEGTGEMEHSRGRGRWHGWLHIVFWILFSIVNSLLPFLYLLLLLACLLLMVLVLPFMFLFWFWILDDWYLSCNIGRRFWDVSSAGLALSVKLEYGWA